jgi:hypothetical protein
MQYQTPFDRLGEALEAAAERQIVPAPAKSRRRGWTLGLFSVVAAFGVGAGAWAATSLLSPGEPVPYAFGPPVAGVAEGAPLPGTVKLLTTTVADPAGGLPWGMRYWETDRKFACVQVGRVYKSKLGQITRGRVFHELRVGVTDNALAGCFLQDGSGHGFAAVQTDAMSGGAPTACPVAMGSLKIDGRSVRCRAQRTVDFGLLGPNASGYTYRVNRRDQTASTLGDVGGYIVVQRHIKPVMTVVGFRHKDPRMDTRVPSGPAGIALTPVSPVMQQVRYAAGTCSVRPTSSPTGACAKQAGYVPIPQPAVGDVRAPLRLRLLGDGRTFRVRFRARQAVIDGRSAYTIEIHRKGAHNSVGRQYGRNLPAGGLVKTTIRARDGWHGTYVVTARFRTVRARPGPMATPPWPGLLVGREEITFR